MFAKKAFIIVVLVVAALQMMLYQPLNILSSRDKGVEYEVEITDSLHSRLFTTVYFTDKNGILRWKDITFKYVMLDDDELYPQIGGRMIIKETTGGFNCKHFDIVKVTYEPERK